MLQIGACPFCRTYCFLCQTVSLIKNILSAFPDKASPPWGEGLFWWKAERQLVYGCSMPSLEPQTLLQSLGTRPIRDAAELRSRLVPLLRNLLDEGRAEAEAKLLENQDGLGCARYLCERMDEVVRIVHDAV